MTLKEKKEELRKKINAAKDENELAELRKQVELLEDLEIEKKDEKEEKIDERSLLRGTIEDLEEEKRKINLQDVKEIEKPKKEERKVDEKELIEQRAKDLKEGKAVKIALDNEEERSVTVSGGTILVPKKYKNEISESFNAVSGMVDMLNTIPLNGGESYSVAFEKGYGEGDYTTEGGDYKDVDVETDYVETGRAKVTAYIEVTNEVKNLPAASYLALISKRVTSAIKKKIGAQTIVGAGTTNTITGIYNANAKVMPTDDKTSDIELAGIDADTLNEITFAYGGDEDVEAPQTLILSKADLKEFAKVKTTDGEFIYAITKNGARGTIAYKDGGLAVPFVINSACNSLSNSETADGKYTMIYGALSDYELPVFSDIEVQESTDYKFKQGMIAYRADAIIGGTVSKYNGFVRVKKKSSIVDPEITNLTITPVEELEVPVAVDTKVAELSATGGTAPYTYSLKDSTGDNSEFKISGTEVQANAEISTAGNKSITVIVTDSKKKTKEATAQIEIAEAGV